MTLVGFKKSIRADDDRIVALLARAYRGERLADIERDLGIPNNAATIMVKRVLRDDLKHSGEPDEVVRAAYRRRAKARAGA